MVICWMKKGNKITYRSAIGSLTGSSIFVNARPGGPHIIKMQIVRYCPLDSPFPTDIGSTVCVHLSSHMFQR